MKKMKMKKKEQTLSTWTRTTARREGHTLTKQYLAFRHRIHHLHLIVSLSLSLPTVSLSMFAQRGLEKDEH